MSDSPTKDFLAPVVEIMQRHGARCTPEEFHAAVNVTFHQFEAVEYDHGHADMWNSLSQQFALVATDCLRKYPDMPDEVHLLDIGCGTGLASECLLNGKLGGRIRSVDLVDTSSEMLLRAGKRARNWNVPVTSHEGTIDQLPTDTKYELIVTCSVLHHVPDLPHFLSEVQKRQAKGGVFLHLQDPNGDYANDPELQRRSKQFNTRLLPDSFYRFTPSRIAKKIYRVLTGAQKEELISKTNQALIDSGLVSSALSVLEIYAITDIHVADGQGVSMENMRRWMPDYQCLSERSYGFFGSLWSSLPPDLQRVEEELSHNNALNGLHIGAAWKLQ